MPDQLNPKPALTDPDQWMAQQAGQQQPGSDIDAFMQQQHQGGTGIFAPGAMSNAQIAPPPTWGQRIRQSLPSIGGAIAGTAASLTAPLWAPAAPLVVPAVAIGAAGLGAAGGNEVKNLIRGIQGLPTPPTAIDRLKEDAAEGLTSGMIPETMGQGLGFVGGKGANIAMRPFAKGRNAKLIEETVNPQELPFHAPQAGAEYGKPFQDNANFRYDAQKKPLEQGYEKLLGGKFGQATELVRTPTGQYTKGQKIAELHSDKIDLLAHGRTSLEAGGGVARRSRVEANKVADKIYKRMEVTAKRHGMDMTQYDSLSSAWKQMEATFGTKEARNVREGMPGEDVIRHLSNPDVWQTFKRPGSKTPVDAKGLLDNLQGQVDSGTWEKTTTAVQKNLLFEASTNGNLNGAKLGAKLDRIEKFLGPDAPRLVPNLQKLKDISKILREHSGTPDSPNMINTKATLTQWALKQMRMETPDLKRMLKQKSGTLDAVEQIMELVARGTNVAGHVAAVQGEPLPEPPPTKK